MLLATGIPRPPTSYADAKKWLELHSGIHLVTHDDKIGAVFVVVGLHGRSAQIQALSAAPGDVEAAFVKAVGTVVTRL